MAVPKISTALCWYKTHWFISYILIMIVISTFTNLIGLSSNMSGMVTLVVFIAHVYIVTIYKKKDCLQLAAKVAIEAAKTVE